MRIEEKTYETSSGELMTTKELILPAKMKSVPAKIRINSNGNEWRLCAVELIHPNGSVETKPAQLFETSYEMFPDSFLPGEDVQIAVQLEGESRGFAKVQLPALERIDVDVFLEAVEFQVDEQIVDKELVV